MMNTQDIVQSLIASPSQGLKAKKSRFSAAAIKRVDANGDGTLSRAELATAIDRLDVAGRAKLVAATEAYGVAMQPAMPRRVLLITQAFSTAAFMVMRFRSQSVAIGVGLYALASTVVGGLIDWRRFGKAAPPLRSTASALFEGN